MIGSSFERLKYDSVEVEGVAGGSESGETFGEGGFSDRGDGGVDILSRSMKHSRNNPPTTWGYVLC